MYEKDAYRNWCKFGIELITSFLTVCLLVALHGREASAQVFEYKYTPDLTVPCDVPQANGEFHVTGYPSIDITFDQGNQKLDIQLDIQPCQLKVGDQEYRILPDGFWLVLDDGPNPKGTAGELAIMYVDGDRKGGGANPVVTIYGYNGENGYRSYKDGVADTGKYGQIGDQVPDYILTSRAQGANTSWLEKIAVKVSSLQQIANEQFFDNRVSFHVVIDTENINTHIPRYPDPEGGAWRGMQFGPQMGIWYHNMVGTTFEYCEEGDVDAPCAEILAHANKALQTAQVNTTDDSARQDVSTYYPGFIKELHFVLAGWFDKAYQDTNQHPYCVTKFETKYPQAKSKKGQRCSLLDIGESFAAHIVGKDDDKGKLKLTYSGQPDGAMIEPVSGTVGEVPLSASFKYQTSLIDQGQDYHVDFRFTDEHGVSKSCPLNLCVKDQLPPRCNLKITTAQPLQCTGETTLLAFDATASSDPDGDALTYSFQSDCKNAQGQAELLTTQGTGKATLILTAPGQGNRVACTVSVTVGDGFYRETCQVPVQVDGCALDCANSPNGSKVPDVCGVCGGDGSSCLDCEGTPGGTKVPDVCGVCGGDGTTCLDCAGTPNGTAMTNRCGVCEGPVDDISCLGCSDVNITEVLVRLDSRSLSQLRMLQRLAKKWKAAGGPVARINKLVTQGEAAHSQNWNTIWTIPSVVTQCANSEFCVSVDNTLATTSFLNGSNDLRRYIRRMINGFVKAKGAGASKKVRKTLQRRNNSLHQENVSAASTIPAFSSACSG